jgi:hydrogenase maturation protein HypF
MSATAPELRASRTSARVRIEGTVQGVGFRPFAFRLAQELELGGCVYNDARGVVVEAEGVAGAVEEFVRRLSNDAPSLAVLDRVEVEWLAPQGTAQFRILQSAAGQAPNAPVTPDTATCADCLDELFDPDDRRFRYPFINCTNCGPRFTIVRGVPYDRPLTTMAGFTMCQTCRAEYENPLDRRFHAQPNACPECGPHLTLLDRSGASVSESQTALADVARALSNGSIVAVKGLGGYHLACLAAHEDAVAALRSRKRREDKPFALMAQDLDAARSLAELSTREEEILAGRERPIVVARRRPGARVAAAVAPRSRDLGVMLPYSPLHHLLVRDVAETLVLTSGNVSDEPIAYRDEDAIERLAAIADLLLVHNRPIETRTDDSVVRATRRRATPLLIRRSRGYVPATIALPIPAARPILACGAELKNTFCLAKGPRAWVSHHVGDLENYETLRSFTDGIEHYRHLFGVEPEVVVHDLHPEYLSTKYALDRDERDVIAVQHHHAHLAACLAEHGERGPAVAAIYDGTGYGTDGAIWGGELMVGGLAACERAGHLVPVRLPGGERAIREPWRMACAWLVASGIDSRVEGVDPRAWGAVDQLVRGGVASPLTTSMGRLFDAIAALCGLRLEVNYEGQAAVELEALCDPEERGFYSLPVTREGGLVLLDPRPAVRELFHELKCGVDRALIAARFHNAVAAATACACMVLAGERDLGTVVLGGGSFQNRRLLEAVAGTLQRAGLRVLVPERLPPNDGGISYGQAAVAATRL